jgi:hypothetical protein
MRPVGNIDNFGNSKTGGYRAQALRPYEYVFNL